MDRRLIRATEVIKRPLRWVWPGRIPLATITILEGDPCHGKSAITYDLTARLTTGQPMPDTEEATPPSGVVLLQAEDSLSATVLPNLQIAGADLEKVALFDRDRFLGDPLTVPTDIPLIENAVQQFGARLIVIDPLTAFLPTNIHADVAVRRFLGPLAAMAEHHDLAVLIVRHLRKSAARNSLYAGAGSIGIIAAARSALVVGHHPSSGEKHSHVLAVNKSNLGNAPSLAYRTVLNPGGAITVEWLGPTDYSAAEIATSPPESDGHSALQDAIYILYSILAEGGLPASEVLRVARAAGVSERTLKRAKRELRVVSTKKGSGRGTQWYWHLPEDDKLLQPLKDRDVGDLIDRLIHGDEDLARPQFKTRYGGNIKRNNLGDDGEGRPVP